MPSEPTKKTDASSIAIPLPTASGVASFVVAVDWAARFGDTLKLTRAATVVKVDTGIVDGDCSRVRLIGRERDDWASRLGDASDLAIRAIVAGNRPVHVVGVDRDRGRGFLT